MLNDDQIDEIKSLAREAANEFIKEFGEALEPADTDWDSTRWDDSDSGKLSFSDDLTGDDWDEAYEIYRDELIEQTMRQAE